jgi:hypothetical protein
VEKYCRVLERFHRAAFNAHKDKMAKRLNLRHLVNLVGCAAA